MIVGILGAGQLGRMLALAGTALGMRFRVLDPAAEPCAATVAEHIRADYDDPDALRALAEGADVVTYEFENVPAAAVESLSASVPVRPGLRSLTVLQDRLTEKTLFRELGIPTPDFEPVSTRAELQAAVDRLGAPCVVKTRRFGYDGKGQAIVSTPEDVDAVWTAIGGADLIVEQFIRFDREVAIIGVRGEGGDHAFYDIVESHHRDGILRWVTPLGDGSLQREAERLAGRLLDDLGHVGALGFEFFQTAEGLMANEAAPRVHNTGHWTIDGARVSQFENHLRAVAGLPLGRTRATGFIGNVNFIGAMPGAASVLALPGVHLHDYDKEPRAGRKVGHATVVAEDTAERDDTLARLRDLADAAEVSAPGLS